LGGAQLLSLFESIAPRLSAFGKEAPRIFRELAVVMSNTGIEMGRLLSIAERFDTFEGAAQSVGKLNAILGGGFLDTMQMVQTTNPTERLLLLRGAIDKAGKSFETMSYYERKAIADAAGFADVNEMSLALNSSLTKNSAAAREKALTDKQMAEVMQSVQSIGEKLSSLWKSMAINLSFVLAPIRKVIDLFLDASKAMGGWSVLLIPVLTVAASAIVKLTFSFLGLGPKLLSSAAGLFKTASAAKGAADGLAKVASPITTVSGAAKEGAIKMLAFAAAAVAVGIGFYLAGQGIAAVGNSMQGLDTVGKVALVAITAIIGGIIALAVVAAPAEIPLLALGAVITLIGAGVWLLGKGISMILAPLSDMGKNLGGLVVALNSASSFKILGIAAAIREVANAIGMVPESKTVVFSTMLREANAVGVTAVPSVTNLVTQAIRYKTSQEESRTETRTQFTKFLETANAASAPSAGDGGGNQTVVLKVDNDVLGRIVGKIVGKQFRNVTIK
jgi:hypothetical protein